MDGKGVGVGLGVDLDRRDAHLFAGANDPYSNFAAIGDQYFFEHIFISGQWQVVSG
jgi:hypothetical protein